VLTQASFILASYRSGAGREVMARSAHALLNTAVLAHYVHYARVTMELTRPRRMFFDQRIPALPRRCINQAVTSRPKITFDGSADK
jgi:hypothetical protein